MSVLLRIGVDEVGRGPLAGPVVAAAVRLDPARPIEGLRDSKKLTEPRRQALALHIRERALAFALAQASPAEIDRLNIRQATFLAMRRAVDQLSETMESWHVLVDGNADPALSGTRHGARIQLVSLETGGDDRFEEISAASILAKVHRDGLMVAYDAQYPGYGLAGHKGYPTAAHREALERLGPSPIHRRSFAPVARCLAEAAVQHPQSERRSRPTRD